MKQPVLYNNVFQLYQNSDYVESNCAEIIFINNGTSNVTLNNTLLLQPTQSFSTDGKNGEMDTTRYNLDFGVSGNNSCVVIRKMYQNYDQVSYLTNK